VPSSGTIRCPGWEYGASDVLSGLNHPLEGLIVVDGEIPVPCHDVTGMDTLDGVVVLFVEDPGWNPEFLQPL
jgi:hypothetical protein